MAARLFDVDMLPCGASHDRCRGVPMLRHGNTDGINVWIVQNPAEVPDAFRFAGLFFRHRCHALFHRPAIDIANGHNLSLWNPEITGNVRHAAPVAAYNGHTHTFIG
ncbi:hypothetical protein SDC9_173346 [bioreactor metagenome]|uniref:Uncharacterized protein n=1 Tax=bioreactor metagenome TaxID=1076179 RepID=A0A645GGV5_9ZZZZ